MLTAALYIEEKKCKLTNTNFRHLRYPTEHLLKCPRTSFQEMPTSHYGNKNILVMVDHLTSWPMVKAIPDKEATTVVNAIFISPYLNMGTQKSFCLIMEKNFQMTLWPMSARGLDNILLPLFFQVKLQDR